MDIKQILSLLNQQKATQVPPTQLVPTGLDLTKINPDLIKEVRQEYLATQKNKEHDDISTATTLTPEVLVYIGRLVKETNVIEVLKKCKQRQDRKERELYAHRQSVISRYNKLKDTIRAKELIGVYDTHALQTLERDMKNELRLLDMEIVKDMDKEVGYLQQQMGMLKVPFFTGHENDMNLQHKVLSILMDMI